MSAQFPDKAGPEGVGSPELAQQEFTTAFNATCSQIGKWLALAAYASRPDTSQSFWRISQSLNEAQGRHATFYFDAQTSLAIRSYCEYGFTSAHLVTSELEPLDDGRVTRRHRLTSRGMLAAAVAGTLIRRQLEFINLSIPDLFGRSSGAAEQNRQSLDLLESIASISLTDFVPARLLLNGAGSKLIDRLVDSAVLEKVSKQDHDQRFFRLVRPKIKYNVEDMKPETMQLYMSAMALLDGQHETITGAQLLEMTSQLFPGADLEALWRRVSNSAPPVFLVPELNPAFSRPSDKVAVRISPAYRDLVEKLLADLKTLAQSKTAADSAVKYAVSILEDDWAVAQLMDIAFNELNPNYGVVPDPDYEGWRADRKPHEKWRPQLPAPPTPNLHIAELAITSAREHPSGQRPLTNIALSRLLEGIAVGMRNSGAGK